MNVETSSSSDLTLPDRSTIALAMLLHFARRESDTHPEFVKMFSAPDVIGLDLTEQIGKAKALLRRAGVTQILDRAFLIMNEHQDYQTNKRLLDYADREIVALCFGKIHSYYEMMNAEISASDSAGVEKRSYFNNMAHGLELWLGLPSSEALAKEAITKLRYARKA